MNSKILNLDFHHAFNFNFKRFHRKNVTIFKHILLKNSGWFFPPCIFLYCTYNYIFLKKLFSKKYHLIFQNVTLPSFESTTKSKLSPGHDLPPDSTCLSWLRLFHEIFKNFSRNLFSSFTYLMSLEALTISLWLAKTALTSSLRMVSTPAIWAGWPLPPDGALTPPYKKITLRLASKLDTIQNYQTNFYIHKK